MVGISALVGLGGAAVGYNTVDVPELEQVTLQTAGAPSANIDAPDVVTDFG